MDFSGQNDKNIPLDDRIGNNSAIREMIQMSSPAIMNHCDLYIIVSMSLGGFILIGVPDFYRDIFQRAQLFK